MKSLPILAALLFQAGTFPSISSAPTPLADPQHLRYVRSLTLPSHASGIACTILDASVYAHAASPSADDLRLFRSTPHSRPQEVPFVVSYSEAQPTDALTASIRNIAVHNSTLSFDLDMPPRAYSEVDLDLAAHNFFATAEVSAPNPHSHSLGTFTLFDLTQRHLARSTALALQETTDPHLHVTLHLRTLDGKPYPNPSPSIIHGVTLPASREAQTLYTVVASGNDITQQPSDSLAHLDIPAHLPIERIQFALDPAFKSDFLRSVHIRAAAQPLPPGTPQELIDGQISRVTRPPDAAAATPAINAAHLSFPAVIASNVHEPAAATVLVENAGAPPLPIRAVQFAMRQRTLCFDAVPNATYTLRYGDNDLRASVYDLGDLNTLPPNPIPAALGREELNPGFLPRRIETTYDQRNPNLFWIALLAVIAVSGSLLSRQAMRQQRRR